MDIGDPLILKDGSGLGAHGLKSGDLGMCNSIVNIPGSDEQYVYFMPQGTKRNYVIEAARVEVDEEAKEAGLDYM
jgi:hypothetical protein